MPHPAILEGPESSRALRGALAAVAYYAVAAFIVVVAHTIPGLWDGIFILVVFLPSVLIGGAAWAITSLFLVRRRWARGALAVHAIVIPLAWWLLPIGVRAA